MLAAEEFREHSERSLLHVSFVLHMSFVDKKMREVYCSVKPDYSEIVLCN